MANIRKINARYKRELKEFKLNLYRNARKKFLVNEDLPLNSKVATGFRSSPEFEEYQKELRKETKRVKSRQSSALYRVRQKERKGELTKSLEGELTNRFSYSTMGDLAPFWTAAKFTDDEDAQVSRFLGAAQNKKKKTTWGIKIDDNEMKLFASQLAFDNALKKAFNPVMNNLKRQKKQGGVVETPGGLTMGVKIEDNETGEEILIARIFTDESEGLEWTEI